MVEVPADWKKYIMRSFMLCTAHQGEYIKWEGKDWACCTYGIEQKCIQDFGGET
jgi:hypothetical protein